MNIWIPPTWLTIQPKIRERKKKFKVSIKEWDEIAGKWVETNVLEGKVTYDEIDEIIDLLKERYNLKLKSVI
jgi:tellurite resistance-related uncharacterized protein